MEGGIRNISQYKFKLNEKLFFDTNIWLHLFGPDLNNNRVASKNYSEAFQRILLKKCEIYIDALVVSEFINVYSKHAWKLSEHKGNTHSNYKRFRDSLEFQSVAVEISEIVRKILNHSRCIGNGFEQFDLDDLLREFAQGGHDINDQVFVRLCMRENFRLVTHDSDFRNKNITVITSNKRLLKSSSK